MSESVNVLDVFVVVVFDFFFKTSGLSERESSLSCIEYECLIFLLECVIVLKTYFCDES